MRVIRLKQDYNREKILILLKVSTRFCVISVKMINLKLVPYIFADFSRFKSR